jgi:hypothetical protein
MRLSQSRSNVSCLAAQWRAPLRCHFLIYFRYLIVRNSKVAYSRAFGYQDREKHVAIKPDAIFRIASMTKPLVSAATMMLVEKGKLQLVTPVSPFLPEFKEVKIGVEKIPGMASDRFGAELGCREEFVIRWHRAKNISASAPSHFHCYKKGILS